MQIKLVVVVVVVVVDTSKQLSVFGLSTRGVFVSG